MPTVGRIDVSIQELASIANECQSCGNDLRNHLVQCHKVMDGLMEDGWESDSGDKLADDFVNMANNNFDNYLAALEAYGQFCADTINAYEQAEAERMREIGSSRLQDIE